MIIDAPSVARFVFAMSAMAMLAASGASAQKSPAAQKTQTPPPQAAPAEPPAAPPEAKPDNPGLLNELGKLFIKPSDLFPSLKSTPDNSAQTSTSPVPPADSGMAGPVAPTVPAAATVTAPATPGVATAPAAPKLPSPGLVPLMVNGRAPCPVSANGSPDCKVGADKLCQDKGYAGGRSLDMDTAHNCSTKALLAGARTIKDICRTETFVTRAMCQ